MEVSQSKPTAASENVGKAKSLQNREHILVCVDSSGVPSE